MIEDILSYSKAATREVACTRVDLDWVVRDIIQSDPRFQCCVEIVNVLPPVFAHQPSLVQAVLNLLSNAVKFVPEKSEPQVRVHSEQRDDQIRLWIEDNGLGIPLEEQSRIFRLFDRLHSAYPGSGIGLAIFANAVERMHGTFGLESDLGKGSRFWLQLPSAY